MLGKLIRFPGGVQSQAPETVAELKRWQEALLIEFTDSTVVDHVMADVLKAVREHLVAADELAKV